MRSRKDILEDIVNLKGNLGELKNEINEHPWDTDEIYIVLNERMISNILDKYRNGIIGIKELNEWADILEARDGISYSSHKVEDLIYKLANPDIYGDLSDKDKEHFLNLK